MDAATDSGSVDEGQIFVDVTRCMVSASDCGARGPRFESHCGRTAVFILITLCRIGPGLKPSFSANPSHCSPSFLLLKYSLHGFPGLFTVISEHICFLLLVSLFLHFLVVGSVR